MLVDERKWLSADQHNRNRESGEDKMMRGEEKICIERQKKSDKRPENVRIDKMSGESKGEGKRNGRQIKRKISKEEEEKDEGDKGWVREGRNDCGLWMEQKESEKEGHLGKHSTIGVIKIKCISMAADKSYGLPTGHAGCWTLTAKHREKPP